ncbi:hypothetical protein JCM10207_005587 [Rhodosporidiobolus poonsookiae]
MASRSSLLQAARPALQPCTCARPSLSPRPRWASTAASPAPSPASSTPSAPSPFRVVAAALVSRPPLILPALSPLERTYYAYQRRLHRALSKPVSASSAWFFKQGSAADKAFTQFDARVSKEDTGAEEEGRAYEAAREEVEGSSEVVGRLETQADKTGDVRSLERKADRTLYLVLKKDRKEHAWQFPQGAVEGTESLADAAVRELKEEVGPDVDVWSVGRVPAGAMEYGMKSKVEGKDKSRVFFMPLRILRGQAVPNKKEGIVDFAWLTKEEVRERVDPKYWAEVEGLMTPALLRLRLRLLGAPSTGFAVPVPGSAPAALTPSLLPFLPARFSSPFPSAALPPFSSWFPTLSNPWVTLADHSLHVRARAEGVRDVRRVRPDWGERAERKARERDAQKGGAGEEAEYVRGTWLGHAGAFVELPFSSPPSSSSLSSSRTRSTSRQTVRILLDPLFSDRASPVSWAGPKKEKGKEAPSSVEELPGVDAVCISHNHYDHLDLPTILSIHAHFPRALYFVPLGNAPWFLSLGIGISPTQVFELDWWDEVDVPVSRLVRPRTRLYDAGGEDSDEEEKAGEAGEEVVRFTCVPSQHRSGRALFDQRTTLWCGWVVERLIPFPSASFSATSTPLPVPRPLAQSHALKYLAWARAPLSGQFKDGEEKPDVHGLLAKMDKGGVALPDEWEEGQRRVREKSRERRWIRRGAVYHAGDTGYRLLASSSTVCPAFRRIGDLYGPFEQSWVPLWRGGTLGFISAVGLRLCEDNLPCATHGTPADAVAIHLDVRSRATIGMHFGTFQGSPLEALQALLELKTAKRAAGVRDLRNRKEGKRGSMGVVDIGETAVVRVQPRVVEE